MNKKRYFYRAYASNCACWVKLGVVATSEEKAIECFEKYLESREAKRWAAEEYGYTKAVLEEGETLDKTDFSYGLEYNIEQSWDEDDLVIRGTINNEPVEQKRRLHKVEFLDSGANG